MSCQKYRKMAEKSIANSNYSDFRKSIPKYSNDEIITILKKRKQYEAEVVDIAVQEAIKRGLIHSDQDLFSKEFQHEIAKSSLFPRINNERNRIKISKSIARGLLIMGTIPAVWGIFTISENNLYEGILLILLGGIWIYASARLMRSISSKMINLLFLMVLASVVYTIKLILGIKNLNAMDIVIPVVLITFVTYGLLFLSKLKD